MKALDSTKALCIAVVMLFLINSAASAQTGNWEDNTSKAKTWTGADVEVRDVIAGKRNVLGQRFLIHTRPQANGDFLQITGDNAKGAWQWKKGITFVRSSGNVGIGTTSPRTSLHVLGRISTGQDFTSAGAITFFPPDGFAWFHIDNGGAGRPTGRLRISGGNNPGDTEFMSILQDGNIGIGTTSPQQRLDVNGTTRTKVLEITGGADLAEPFNITTTNALMPGMVVSIDPLRPGQLRLAEQAYDRTVAGIISGAGGVNPGMIMGQRGSEADGQHPVALSGRVYVHVDASYGAVEPGDLLTTSGTPGHAMKVTNYTKAQGAVIGKAMTSLKEGKGLVLVLVSLQ